MGIKIRTRGGKTIAYDEFRFGRRWITLLIEFQTEKYDPAHFKRDIKSYITENKIVDLEEDYPNFDYFIKTVSETLRAVMPQVLSKVPYVIQGDPFVIELRVHNAEEYDEETKKYKPDQYDSNHDEKFSRLDHMYIDLNGKKLTDIFVAPFYFRRMSYVNMPDVRLRLIIDLVGLFQYQCSLPRYRYTRRLKNRVMKRYRLTRKYVDKITYTRLILLFEFFSDLKIEGFADFFRRTGEGLVFDLPRVERFRKKIDEMVKLIRRPNTLEQIKKIYDDEYYDDDLEICGRYMCFFIALAMGKHMHLKNHRMKGITSKRVYYPFEKLNEVLAKGLVIDALPPRVCEKAIKHIRSIEAKSHHSKFIYLYTRACKDLKILPKFTIMDYGDYEEWKTRALKGAQEDWEHWLEDQQFFREPMSFGEVLRKHFAYKLL